MAQLFADAAVYEEIMGRWSRRLAPLFLDFARLEGQRVLDVGCGTGSLIASILERAPGAKICGIDPSDAFVQYAQSRFPGAPVKLERGSAAKLPYDLASFDAALSLLVFQFLKEPVVAAGERRRVTRSGGTVAACTWERTGLEMNEHFWQEALRLDPAAEEKAQRPKVCNQIGQLAEAWRAAGLRDVEEVVLEMRTDFTGFDDFWNPYTKGVVPQGVYVLSLSHEQRELLRQALRIRFVGERDRPFSLRAAVLAVRGTVPG